MEFLINPKHPLNVSKHQVDYLVDSIHSISSYWISILILNILFQQCIVFHLTPDELICDVRVKWIRNNVYFSTTDHHVMYHVTSSLHPLAVGLLTHSMWRIKLEKNQKWKFSEFWCQACQNITSMWTERPIIRFHKIREKYKSRSWHAVLI